MKVHQTEARNNIDKIYSSVTEHINLPWIASKLPSECSLNLFLRNAEIETINQPFSNPIVITIVIDREKDIHRIYSRLVEKRLIFSKFICSVTLTHYMPLSTELLPRDLEDLDTLHSENLEIVFYDFIVSLAFSLYSKRLYNFVTLWTHPKNMRDIDSISYYLKTSVTLFAIFYFEGKTSNSICVLKSNHVPLWQNFFCMRSFEFKRDFLDSVLFETSLVYPQLPSLKARNTHPQNIKTFKTPFEADDYTWYLLDEIVIKKANISYISASDPPTIFEKAAVIEDIEGYRQNLPSYHSDVVFVSSEELRYITCYRRPQMNFKLYVDPFDTHTWVTILMTIAFLSCLLFHVSSLLKLHLVTPSSVVLHVTSLLCDDSAALPSRLTKAIHARIGISGWLLTINTFITAYIGFVASKLTSLDKNGEVNGFSDITCQSNFTIPLDCLIKKNIYKKVPEEFHEMNIKLYNFWLSFEKEFTRKHVWWRRGNKNKTLRDYNNNLYNRNCFSLLSSPRPGYHLMQNPLKFQHPIYFNSLPQTLQYLFYLLSEEYRWDRYEVNSRIHEISYETYALINRVTNFLSPTSVRHPEFTNEELHEMVSNFELGSSAIEAELIQCKNSAFVGFEREIKFEKKYLTANYFRRQFYSPPNKLFNERRYWVFMCFLKSKIPFYFKQLINSGIVDMVQDIFEFKFQLKRPHATRQLIKMFKAYEHVVPLTIDGPVQTVFILFCGMVIVDICAFIIEKYNVCFLLCWYKVLGNQSLSSIIRQANKILSWNWRKKSRVKKIPIINTKRKRAQKKTLRLYSLQTTLQK